MQLFNKGSGVSFDSLRSVVGLVRKVASKLGGFAGSTSATTDSTCDRAAGLDKIPPLVRGLVVRSGIGSYDCEVVIGDGKTIVCSALAPILHETYGVSQACMPVPGSTVLVYVATTGLGRQPGNYGVILGVLPDSSVHGVTMSDKANVKRFAETDFPEGGVAQFTESGPAAIASDSHYLYHGEHQCGRPHDMVPGEYGLLNHNGAGMIIGALSTAIKGSEMASVRCSALDDQVRVVSGHFRHVNAAGSDEIYNDGGFISVESSVSMYQSERLGVKSQNTPAFTWSPGELLSLREVRSGVEPLKPKQTAKKRLYRYEGYLGDVVNVFVANPDPDKDVESMDSGAKDQGLLHYHVDSSGRFTMRSAGGILFERYDRIPVPKRTHYAWDPEGHNAEDSLPEDKAGFVIDEQYPAGIGLALGDMAAWWNDRAYSRFVQFDKDFTVLKQDELKCPDDEYDKIGNGHENYSKYDTRHSYIGLTPDGGIVLRDAWGSEIVMADGRITLNAAANIEVRSGSSVVILGGDDVIAKAYNSMDLSTTNKDVRIKAENNLQILSNTRGVLIQSKGKGGADWSKDGEEMVSAGVVVKADEGNVSVIGNKADIQGISSASISSFDKSGKPSGNVVLAGKSVSAASDGNVVLTAKNGASGVYISEQSAVVCAPSALLIGGNSAAEASRDKMLIGLPVDFENLYSQVISVCKSVSQTYLEDSSLAWLYPVTPKTFSEITFKFRTTKQYGTDSDSGIKGGVFSVYEPAWAVMASASRKVMNGCRTKAWEEKKISGQEEYPWPGKEAMEQQGYVKYEEKNVTGSDGTEAPNTGTAQFQRGSFSEYHIRTR